ncbi:hypothetical protein [Streptomyces sp. NPDC006368]|uniref:hypothetical protein n=1 Tax=Streptomyces sp. NPDC006368 TaxID=3156760 RepID=UPI0033BEF79B
MSSDQQYPSYGEQPYGTPAHGNRPYENPSHDDPSHGDASHGDPSYDSPSHDASYDNQAYGNPAYGNQAYDSQAYGNRTYGSPDQGAPSYGYQDPGVAQAWDGRTWDTHHQPAVPPSPAAPRQDAARTAYLTPPQGSGPAPVSYPLPPEVPYDTPTTVLRPVAPEPGPGPAPVAASSVAAPPGTAAPEYSAPTTLGSARLTDAQRARAEGRSPIIDPGLQPAALTALLGVLLAAGAALGTYGLLLPLILLQAVTAAGWFRLNGMWPARQGIALAFAGGVTADIVLLAAGREHGPAAILGTLGVWVLLVLVLQLRSRASADERQYGLMATVASAALTIVATGHLAAVPDAVIVGSLAVAVTVLARALPLPGAASLVVALIAAAGAGVAAGGLTGTGSSGALLGLGAGVCALIGHRVAAYDYPSRFVHMTAGVALPLAAAAPAVHLLGRALV